MEATDTIGAAAVWTAESDTAAGLESEMEKQGRGFAGMDPEKQRKIASKGGKAAHAKGTAHEWDSAAAQSAGRKGGKASRGGRAVALNEQFCVPCKKGHTHHMSILAAASCDLGDD